MSSYLLHLGFAVGALAYALRDVLWLRVVAAGSYAIFAVYAIGRGPDTALTLVPWYAAFIAINIAHVGLLVYWRCVWRFTVDEAALHASAFPTLSRLPAKRLIRSGTWATLTPGEVLTREGVLSQRIYLIASGWVQVAVGDRPIVKLGPGEFVGEIGFTAQRPASATATAILDPGGLPTKVLCWDVSGLRRRMRRDDELRSAMDSALGGNLARKIADQTVLIHREPTETRPEQGGMPSAA